REGHGRRLYRRERPHRSPQAGLGHLRQPGEQQRREERVGRARHRPRADEQPGVGRQRRAHARDRVDHVAGADHPPAPEPLADRLLWDGVTLLDDAVAAAVEATGGLRAIAISHPHYYTAMVDWAERFDVPILLHAEDAEHVMRPSPRIEHWTGDRRPLWPGL